MLRCIARVVFSLTPHFTRLPLQTGDIVKDALKQMAKCEPHFLVIAALHTASRAQMLAGSRSIDRGQHPESAASSQHKSAPQQQAPGENATVAAVGQANRCAGGGPAANPHIIALCTCARSSVVADAISYVHAIAEERQQLRRDLIAQPASLVSCHAQAAVVLFAGRAPAAALLGLHCSSGPAHFSNIFHALRSHRKRHRGAHFLDHQRHAARHCTRMDPDDRRACTSPPPLKSLP